MKLEILLGEKEIRVWGDGSPTREFLYSEDAARGIVMATQSYNDSEPVNLGTGRNFHPQLGYPRADGV